jgi:hypothetical protein
MSGFKGGSNKSSINRNLGKSLLSRGINIPFSELSSEEVREVSEGINNGSIGNNSSGGLTDDQEIEDSQLVGSTVDDTVIGGTTPSSATFTTVRITNDSAATSSTTGALIVDGGIGVAKNSYFGDELHASEFHGCGRHITSILGENVIGNVTAEPNYLIIKVGQHCVNPPNVAPNINAVGIGSGHWLFGYNSLIAGGKYSNNYSRLSAIVAGNSQAIYNGGNLSIILGGDNNKISGSESGILSSKYSNVTGLSSLVLGGNNNLVTGNNSAAVGSNITISHNGSTLISDNQATTYSSDTNNQFKVRASGGSVFNSTLSVVGAASLSSTLNVTGTTTLTDEVSINSVSESTTPSDGALTVAGGVGIGKDLRLGDDLSLNSDNCNIFLGVSSEVSLTHIPSTGLRLNSGNKLQFRDADIHVSSDADGYLNLQADTGVNININNTDELSITATESTFDGNIVIPNNLFIGSSSDQDAISISNLGEISLSSNIASTSTSSGTLQVTGGVGISQDLYIGDDLNLNSDGSIINFGSDNDVNLTHIHNTGLKLNDNMKLQFRDSDIHINSSADGDLNLQADSSIKLNINGTNELTITPSTSTFHGNLVIPNNNLIGSESKTNAIVISDQGNIKLNSTTETSSINTGALVISGGVGVGKDLYLGDDLNLNSDGSIINFGSDSEVNLTHVHNTGLKLNNNMKLQFRDSDIHINSNSDGNLNLQADSALKLNINGTNELIITPSTSTFHGNIVIPNNNLIGSESKVNALEISDQGNITVNSTTETSSINTGALVVSGGVGIGKDLYLGDDLFLNSNNSQLNFGSSNDVNLKHIPSTGLLLNNSNKLLFRDSNIYINSESNGELNIQSNTIINLNIDGTDEITVRSTDVTFGGDLIIPDSGNIGTNSDLDAINISSTGVVSLSSTVESNNSTTGALNVAGGVGITKKLNVNGISSFNDKIIVGNTITGNVNMILGSNNVNNIINSSILGASNSNISLGNFSSIVSGNNQTLSSNNSIILNGKDNNNQSDYSICSGFGSKTENLGQISHAMGYFNKVGDSQSSNFIFRRTITHISGNEYKIGINNLEPTVSNDASITLDSNSLFSYHLNLTGISTTNNKFWNFILKGIVYRDSLGNYSHIKGTKEIIIKNKLSDDANIEVNSTYGIYLNIKINSNYTIQWVSSLNAVENKL